MHSATDGELTFDVAVVRRYSRPSRSESKRLPPTTLVYAVVGKRLRRQGRRRSFPSLVEAYRRRFGMESSYRQINQARRAYIFSLSRVKVTGCSDCLVVAKSVDFVSMDEFASLWSRSPLL
jgi:hypothetical protein